MNYKQEVFDIIVIGGQSNAEGSGHGKAEKEWIKNENILSLEVEKEIRWTPDRTWVIYPNKPFDIVVAEEKNGNGVLYGDFSLAFALSYLNKKTTDDGRKVLIIKAAVGGTAFCDGNWGIGGILYNKLLEMTDYALSLNPQNRLIAFLWHQGESDYLHKNDVSVFREQLRKMFADFRSRYGNVSVVAGDFVQEWKRANAGCYPFADAIEKTTKEIGNAGFVRTDGLKSNGQVFGDGDDIHFCRQALNELGERYFNVYKTLKP